MWSTPYAIYGSSWSVFATSKYGGFTHCGIKDGSLRNWAVHGGSFARIIWRMKPSPCLQFTMWPLAFLVLKVGISGWFQLCVGSDGVKKTHHFFWCQVHQYHQLPVTQGSICLENSHTLQFNLAHRITRFCRSSPAYGYKITLEKLFFEALHCFLALNEILWLCQQTFRWWVFSAWNVFFPKKKTASQEVLANARVDQREMSLKLLELMTRMFAEEVGWELGWLEVGLLKMSTLGLGSWYLFWANLLATENTTDFPQMVV